MIWDIISAIGSIGAALVLLVASIAALLQLKHIRLSNQLTSYLHIMDKLWDPEMAEARSWIESQDFSDPAVLDSTYKDGKLDHRVRMFGAYYQGVARLLNYGVLDEDLFGPPLLSSFSTVWKLLEPIAMRARADMRQPVYSDIEYIVYRYATGLSTMKLRPYSADFCKRLAIEDLPERCAQIASHALETAPLAAP